MTIGKTLFRNVVLVLTGLSCHSLYAEQKPMSNTQLTIVNPKGLYDPTPYGYSHMVVANSPGRVAFVAGQGGEDHTGKLKPDFAGQVAQAYKNLLTTLHALNARPEQVIKINTYVVDYDEIKLDIMTRELKNAFGDWLPAQTLVPVPRLALNGMLFEVDATVILGEESYNE